MIAEPPSEEAVQLIITLVPEIVVVGAAGVEGAVGNVAPLPSEDGAEGPTEFMAVILALTLDPFGRLYGVVFKVEIVTVQEIAVPVQPA